ncbi:MAG: peptidoglycan DD-metalloendopeptidase family protein [Phascolarctobacterium sp.]
MMNKLSTCKKLMSFWRQLEGGYTIMLVPHDGRSISKKDMHTTQLKRAATYIGVLTIGTAGVILLLASMLYVSSKEARELAEYREIKAQQEQKLQELAKNTEAVQKQLAVLHKIESQVREQMKKSGMEVPGKSELAEKAGGKGGPSKNKISDLVVLQEQNALLQQNLQASTQDWDNLLTSIKTENYRQEVTPNLWPVDGGYISSEFGSRANPFDGYSSDYHPGIDIADNYGAPVYASASGYVQRAGWYGGYGKYIKISHDYGYATAYGHLSSIEISAGDYVSKGQLIGYVGSTGYSTGPHLHFEVLLHGKQVNPRRLMK